MKKMIFILFLSILFSSVLVLANEPSQYIKQNDVGDIKVYCYNTGDQCSANSSCNLTVNYPNGTNIFVNQEMTNNIAYHNYTLSDTSVFGVYSCSVTCDDLGNKESEEFFVEINHSGHAPNNFFTIGAILVVIVASCLYLVSAFKINEQHFKIRVVLLFTSFTNILALIIIGKLTQLDYYYIPYVLDALILINTIIIAYMGYKYVQYVINLSKEQD